MKALISDIIRLMAAKMCLNAGSGAKGFITDIEKDTKSNTNFRKVLYTGKHSQLVLMALKAGEDIGEEVHNVDQFFRIDGGAGNVVINGKESAIKDGSAFIVPAGAKHNVIAGPDGLKLYSVYSPPQHMDGTVHKTKDEATEEHFDGKTTESDSKKAYVRKKKKTEVGDEEIALWYMKTPKGLKQVDNQ